MVLDQFGVSSVGHVALYDARRCVLRSLVRNYCHCGAKIENWANYGFGGLVLIRTGLGTVAVLVGFVVAVAELRNFTGAFIGTWHIWADLY